jgi:hypothetical protein
MKLVTFHDFWRTRDELDIRYETIYREMRARRSKLFILALSVAICTSEVSRITKKYFNRPVTTEYTETNMEKAEFPVMLLTFDQRDNNDSDLLDIPIPRNLKAILGTKAFKPNYERQFVETWANAQWMEYIADLEKSLVFEELVSEKLYYTVQEELFYKPNDNDTLRFFSRLLWIMVFESAKTKIECSTHRRSSCGSKGPVSTLSRYQMQSATFVDDPDVPGLTIFRTSGEFITTSSLVVTKLALFSSPYTNVSPRNSSKG